jgi:hypothetical protein
MKGTEGLSLGRMCGNILETEGSEDAGILEEPQNLDPRAFRKAWFSLSGGLGENAESQG